MDYIVTLKSGLILSVRAVQPICAVQMQFVQSKMRNCAVQKHKVKDIIVQFSLQCKIQNKEANLLLSSNVQMLKCCQLQGGLSPLIPWGSAPGPRWGLCPQTPSRSALAINISICADQNFKPCLKSRLWVTQGYWERNH